MMSSFSRLRALAGLLLLAVVVSGRSGFLGYNGFGAATPLPFGVMPPGGNANAIALPAQHVGAYPPNAVGGWFPFHTPNAVGGWFPFHTPNAVGGWFPNHTPWADGSRPPNAPYAPGTSAPVMLVPVPYGGMFPAQQQEGPPLQEKQPFRFDPAAPAFVPESARPSPTSQEQEESQPFYPASAVETAEATITLLSGAHLATFPLQVRRLDAVGEVDTPADSTCVVLGGPDRFFGEGLRREGGLPGLLSRSVAETLQLPVGFVDKTFSFLQSSGGKGGASVGKTNNVVDCVVVDVASTPPSVAAGVPGERADEENEEESPPPPKKQLRVVFSAVVTELYTSENAGRCRYRKTRVVDRNTPDTRLGVLAEMDKLLRPDNFSQFLSEDGSHLTEDGQFIFDNLHQSWQNLLEYVDDNVRPLSYRHQDAAILQRTDPAAFLLVQNNSADLAHLGDSLLALVSWCAKLGGEAIARVAAASTKSTTKAGGRPGRGLPPAFVVDFVEKLAKLFAPMDDEQRDDFGPPVRELLFRLNPAQRTFFTSNADDNRAFFRFNASMVVVLSLGGKRGPPGAIGEAGRLEDDLQPGLVDAILKSDLWQEQDLSGGEGAGRGEPGGRGEPWRVLMKRIVRLLGETMLQDSDESVLDMPLAHRAAGALGFVGRELVRRSRISGRSEGAKPAADGAARSPSFSTSAVHGGLNFKLGLDEFEFIYLHGGEVEAPAVHGEDQLNVLRRNLRALLPRESADLLQFVLTTLKQPLLKGWGLWSARNLALYESEIPDVVDRAKAKRKWELAPLVEAFGSIGRVVLHVVHDVVPRSRDGPLSASASWPPQSAVQWARTLVLGNIFWEARVGAVLAGPPLFLRALEEGVESRIYCGRKTNWYWSYGEIGREGGAGPVVSQGRRRSSEDWEDEDWEDEDWEDEDWEDEDREHEDWEDEDWEDEDWEDDDWEDEDFRTDRAIELFIKE